MQGCTDDLPAAPLEAFAATAPTPWASRPSRGKVAALRSARAFWAVGLLLIALAGTLQAYAIWSCTCPPLIDLPNHMARHYLEAVLLGGGSIDPSYEFHVRLLPNLGGDIVLPPLILWLGPLPACKLFLTVAVFLYWFGPAVFILQQGGDRRSALAAALLLLPLSFSSQFFWGFLNFYSGVGLAFLVLAHFGSLCRRDAPGFLRLLLHSLLVALLFVWHLAPWVIYGALMGCQLLADSLKRYRSGGTTRQVLGRCAQLTLPVLPSLVLFVCYTHTASHGVDPATGYDWGGWEHKITAILSLFRSYSWTADALVVVLWSSVLLTWFGVAVVRQRWGTLHLSAAVLAGMYLILPFRLGGTLDADGRLLPALLVCAVALLGSVPVRHFGWGALLLALCLVLRFGSVAYSWQQLSAELDEQAQAFGRIEPHSRVLPIVLLPAPSKEFPERHFSAWLVPARSAFVPTLFAAPDQQPLTIHGPGTTAVHRQGETVEIRGDLVREQYDYVWVCNRAAKTVRVPETFEAVFAVRDLTVWRVRRAGATALARR